MAFDPETEDLKVTSVSDLLFIGYPDLYPAVFYQQVRSITPQTGQLKPKFPCLAFLWSLNDSRGGIRGHVIDD